MGLNSCLFFVFFEVVFQLKVVGFDQSILVSFVSLVSLSTKLVTSLKCNVVT